MNDKRNFKVIRGGEQSEPERDADHGLTADELTQMLGRPGSRHKGLVTVVNSVSPQLLIDVPIVQRVAGLLRLVLADEGIRLTKKGNLSQAAVVHLTEEYYSRHSDYVRNIRREEDCPELRFDHSLAERAGLLKVEKNRLIAGAHFVNPDNPQDLSRLYARLLSTLLSRPQLLEAMDGYNDAGICSAGLLYMLHLLRGNKGELFYPEDFAEALLPHFHDRFAKIPPGWQLPINELRGSLSLRFFTRFCVTFGLCSPAAEPWKPPFPVYPPEPDGTDDQNGSPVNSINSFNSMDRIAYLRRDGAPFTRSELFAVALDWQVPAPPGEGFGPAGQRHPEGAGFEWAQEAMELQRAFEFSPMIAYDSKIALLRSMERCPHLPDPYCLWAGLFPDRPEYVLSVVNTGLEACAEMEPEVPSGISPWRDHLYRDVIRMQLMRASALADLGRTDEAIQQLTALLESMPEDELQIRHRIFNLCILTSRLEYAAKLIAQKYAFADSCDPWNAVLLAYANGAAARPLAEEALLANPLVPQLLSWRQPPDPGGHYDDPREADARYYVSLTWDAWKSVKGARAWCRKLRDS